jgi:putative oxidoreductase
VGLFLSVDCVSSPAIIIKQERTLMTIQSSTAITFLRIVIAGIMISHGCMRTYLDSVWGFGEFLASKGIPFGPFVAWGLTVFEILGGSILMAGRFVKPIALIFAVHLTTGIFFVHLPNGWFVVGAGRNGIEYSVLLVASFLTVALSRPKWN